MADPSSSVRPGILIIHVLFPVGFVLLNEDSPAGSPDAFRRTDLFTQAACHQIRIELVGRKSFSDNEYGSMQANHEGVGLRL